jgi:Ethanolamine utilization protein EutJ (predicted chaperonin)
MAEATVMVDGYCREQAEEIAEQLPENPEAARRVLEYLQSIMEKRFAEAATALPPAISALTAIMSVVEFV